jgi:hypothetical protein
MELEALSGLLSMPFRTYLDRHTFDGETIRQMGIAFEMALAALGFTRAATTPFVGHWLRASSSWRNTASAILSVSASVPCRQSVLLSSGIVRRSSRSDSPQNFGGSFDISSGQTVSTTALISSVTASRTGVSTK